MTQGDAREGSQDGECTCRATGDDGDREYEQAAATTVLLKGRASKTVLMIDLGECRAVVPRGFEGR